MRMVSLHETLVKNHKYSIHQVGGVLHHTHNLSFSYSIYIVKIEGEGELTTNETRAEGAMLGWGRPGRNSRVVERHRGYARRSRRWAWAVRPRWKT
jgi:hypothetical protein